MNVYQFAMAREYHRLSEAKAGGPLDPKGEKLYRILAEWLEEDYAEEPDITKKAPLVVTTNGA